MATAATVVLFVAALGTAIWRYEAAPDHYDLAVKREDGANAGRDAIVASWEQQAELAQFAATRDPEHYKHFETATVALGRALRDLREQDDEILNPLIDDARRDHGTFVSAARAARAQLKEGQLGNLTDEGLGAGGT